MSTYHVLIVDDEKEHLNTIQKMIEDGAFALRGTLGLSEKDKVEIETDSDAGRIVSAIQEDQLIPYDVILADIFMPLREGEDPCLEGGAKRIYEVIKQKNLQEDVLLVIITGRKSEAIRWLRLVDNEQQTLKIPWAIPYVKHEQTLGPDIIEDLLKEETWTFAVCRAITKCKDNEWKRTFIGATLYEIVGLSTPLNEAKIRAEKYANERVIMLTGETGTGKELIARAIHKNSERAKNGEFIPQNCSGIHENFIESEIFGHEKGAFTDAKDRRAGLLEKSKDGTVFLDEFGSEEEQTRQLDRKLRRLLSEWNYRTVGGTEDLSFNGSIIFGGSALADAKKHRVISDDLYRRIQEYHIHLPPLRERQEDIIPLAEFFLKKYAKEKKNPVRKISPDARKALIDYDWPGNVGQLEELMKDFATFHPKEKIKANDVNEKLWIPFNEISTHISYENITKEQLIEVMNRPAVKGNVVKTAKILFKGYKQQQYPSHVRKNVTNLIKKFSKEDPLFYSKIPAYRPQGGRPRSS